MDQLTTIPLLGYSVFAGTREVFPDGVGGVIDTLNPHSYVIAREDRQFSNALKSADLLIPDGVGIKIAARVLAGKKIERITGSDLHEAILGSLNRRKGSCFYLGASQDTLLKIRVRLAREYPSVRAEFYSPPFREVFSTGESEEMITAVNSFAPDVLFVGMTAPKQEKWVHENRDRLEAPLICPIGAVFDFYAGTVRRSGDFWIRMGLEWLPRLLREPARLWKRNFVSTPLFLWYVAKEKLRFIRKKI